MTATHLLVEGFGPDEVPSEFLTHTMDVAEELGPTVEGISILRGESDSGQEEDQLGRFMVSWWPHSQFHVGGPSRLVDADSGEEAIREAVTDDEFAAQIDFNLGVFVAYAIAPETRTIVDADAVGSFDDD